MTDTATLEAEVAEVTPATTATAKLEKAELVAAIVVRAAESSGGLVGGVGLKAKDVEKLQKRLRQPDGAQEIQALVCARVVNALTKAGITYGIIEEEVAAAAEEFTGLLESGQGAMVTHKVAAGEAPEPGADGRVEYTLNYRGQPFAKLANLAPKSTRKSCHVVSANQVLAVLHAARPPADGTSVKGEAIAADAKPVSASLSAVAGDNTQIAGNDLKATCDGLCEEDASGWIRVIPEIIVDNVDAGTGRLPESGISQANIVVRGEVRGEFGVATCENLFVGEGETSGGISGSAEIQARNLVATGTVAGSSEGRGAPLTIRETCVVGEVVGRTLSAGRILVARDSHLGRLEADTEIRIDGSVRGGAIRCAAHTQVAGDVGTEAGGSNTRIILPASDGQSRRQRQDAAAAREYKQKMASLREELDELSDQSDKRAKSDPYWSQLIDDEAPDPTTSMQKNALQQFETFTERRRKLEQQTSALGKALQRVQSDDEGEEAEAEASAATLMVRGQIHPDVVFEVQRELQAEDGELPVNFTHDGKRFRGHKLSDVRSQLTQAAGAYLERQGAQVEEKREAIEKMFEGQEAKPTGPQVADRKFEIPVTWAPREGEEEDELLEISAVVYLNSSDPQKIVVQNLARPREALTNVSISLQAEGARGVFAVTPGEEEVIPWQEDPAISEDLAGIEVLGVSALQAMKGEADFTSPPTPAADADEDGGE